MYGVIPEDEDFENEVDDDVIIPSSTRPTLKGVFEVENDDEDQKQTPLLQFLQDLQLDDYYDLFLEHKMSLELISECSDEDFFKMGLPLGVRKTVMKAIRQNHAANDVTDDDVSFF